MKKNKSKQNIIALCIVFILLFIKTKLTGSFGRISYGPVSFEETIDKIPGMLVASVVIVILGNLIDKEIKKSEEKRIETARKRMVEREKKEQEEKYTQNNHEREKEKNNK